MKALTDTELTALVNQANTIVRNSNTAGMNHPPAVAVIIQHLIERETSLS